MVNDRKEIVFDESHVNEVYKYVYRTVTRFDGVHDEYCTSTAVENGPSYRVLAKLLQATTGKLATSAEVRAHLEKIGVRGAGQISDAQMQRVKRCHEEMHLESFHKSFSFVQSKLGTLVDRNPVDLQTIQLEDSNGEKSERFYRMYFILKSDIDVALHCKPVLSFDAGALKLSQWSRYQVMVCGMQDGDKHDCSVGFAIVNCYCSKGRDEVIIWTTSVSVLNNNRLQMRRRC